MWDHIFQYTNTVNQVEPPIEQPSQVQAEGLQMMYPRALSRSSMSHTPDTDQDTCMVPV